MPPKQAAPPPPPPPAELLHLNVFDPDRIRLYAESCGVAGATAVTSQAYNVLSEEITDIVRRLLINSKKMAIHSRRARVETRDIEYACKDNGMSPPLGYFCRPHKELKHVPNPSGEDIYVREEQDIDIGEALGYPLPKLPKHSFLRAHWLVINGEVPQIVENILPAKPKREKEPAETGESSAPGALAQRRYSVIAEDSPAAAYKIAARNTLEKETAYVKPLPPAKLSLEKQVFVKTVIEACVGLDDKARLAGLTSLEVDTGIQDCLQTIALIVKNGVRANVVHKCLSMLIYLVRIVRALSSNKALCLEPVLHHLIPSLLTCMLGRQLCMRPDSDNHWALRDFSGRTLCSMIKDHLKNPEQTMARIVRQCRKIFDDPECSMAMVYGSMPPLLEFTTYVDKINMLSRLYEQIERVNAAMIEEGNEVANLEAGKLKPILEKMDREWNDCLRKMIY